MIKYMKTALAIAEIIALESSCVKKQIGCVILKPVSGTKAYNIIGTGCNGTLPNSENCCDVAKRWKWDMTSEHDRAQHRQWSSLHEVHAEQNAIMRLNESAEGCILVTTLLPCVECIKWVITAGITKIIYSDAHPNTADTVLTICRERGISTQQCSI